MAQEFAIFPKQGMTHFFRYMVAKSLRTMIRSNNKSMLSTFWNNQYGILFEPFPQCNQRAVQIILGLDINHDKHLDRNRSIVV